MDSIITSLLTKMVAGGPGAMFAAMVFIIAIETWIIKHLWSTVQKKDERIDKIFDEYHKGNITMTDALNSLKYVLFEIKGRLSDKN